MFPNHIGTVIIPESWCHHIIRGRTKPRSVASEEVFTQLREDAPISIHSRIGVPIKTPLWSCTWKRDLDILYSLTTHN